MFRNYNDSLTNATKIARLNKADFVNMQAILIILIFGGNLRS